MKDTIRTFIAIKIVPEKKLSGLISEVRSLLRAEEIRWVNLDNLHLTLRFLGETSPQQISEVTKILEFVSQQFHPFRFTLKGTGFFKSKGQPKVLHLGIEDDHDLKTLAVQIEEELVKSGFPNDGRDFRPHLTIGRLKYISDKNGFQDLIKRLSAIYIQQVFVTELIFYQSILGTEGPTYIPIKNFQLKNSEV